MCSSTGDRPASGHRSVPHTADTRIEAWAPTREGCLAEALRGFVATFAECPAERGPERTVAVAFGPAADDDLLVTALEEVIYRLEVDGELPVDAQAARLPDGGLEMRLAMAPAEAFAPVGAAPKAVSWQQLRFGRGEAGWCCAATVDV